MYKVYQRTGGKAAWLEYEKRLKMFFLHTMNSHVYGETSDPSSQDAMGFYLHPSPDCAESAVMEKLSINDEEVLLIFNSIDEVHAYT